MPGEAIPRPAVVCRPCYTPCVIESVDSICRDDMQYYNYDNTKTLNNTPSGAKECCESTDPERQETAKTFLFLFSSSSDRPVQVV